jgi:probable rRNA maturation factor
VDENLDKILFHRIVALLKKEFNFSIKQLYINIVNSEYLLEINRKFLRHNYHTDIITFDYSKKKLLFDAELYISLQDAEKNAKTYNVSLEQELMRLVIHGVLHLLGFDDKNSKKRVVMKKIEDKLVNEYKYLTNQVR